MTDTDSLRAKRQRQPELEADFNRNPSLGYEPSAQVGFIRCLDHGYPTPLARWHCHDEYEFHLITATSGKAFVGDWIGRFEPGHAVLCGPRLPHNWISHDISEAGVAQRDLVIQFLHAPIANGCESMPELREVLPLLERARYGIEFFGFAQSGEAYWRRVKAAKGLRRLIAFLELLTELARWTEYRLLSSVQMRGLDNAAELDQINAIVNRISQDIVQPPGAAELASELGMSESRFSRFFRRATGNTYTDFVNHVRISRACQLLMSSGSYITNICYEVGFNNVANFNRRFLEIKGMTPSEYRRQAESRFGSNSG
jgi:AraC-like DNA-binding protein